MQGRSSEFSFSELVRWFRPFVSNESTFCSRSKLFAKEQGAVVKRFDKNAENHYKINKFEPKESVVLFSDRTAWQRREYEKTKH